MLRNIPNFVVLSLKKFSQIVIKGLLEHHTKNNGLYHSIEIKTVCMCWC